ncbi:hypothetical protein Pmani_038771 [Petrolisthes manimaculis]|uniref:Uncharacterized protein n=1 Tax=Petrolisthes manimaculis TaxID=1843537 RepID=A0AAE1TK73_9EUCA|nr:hypothetical protein Pmani_038771 [Petrolisthes manimaculis]
MMVLRYCARDALHDSCNARVLSTDRSNSCRALSDKRRCSAKSSGKLDLIPVEHRRGSVQGEKLKSATDAIMKLSSLSGTFLGVTPLNMRISLKAWLWHLRAEGKAWQEEGRWWEAWEERGQSVGRQLHPIQGHHERLGRTFYIGTSCT